MRIQGSTALVTGGAGGIGRAVARRFAASGARVVLWDRDAGALEEAARELASLGQPVRTAAVDVTDSAAVNEEAARLAREGWAVDIVDANAGAAFPGELIEMEEAKLKTTIRVNLDAVVWTLRAFVPPMIKRLRGHVVFMASASSFTGVPGLAVYAATKHAIIGLAESLRLELRRRGCLSVGVTIVCPGFVRTAMFEGVRPPVLLPWLTPDDVAAAVCRGVEEGRLYVREPWIVRVLPLLRAVAPTFIQDGLGDLLGLNHTTDDWRERASEASG
ncbi:MAG: SDR family NAD(P)-dependent oxidoreductase [Elusimicrobia bacterium]|nr:SDR family NAD(P)-dependent oxidoreductase [Elusimicrobiota bacterium]